MKGQKGKRRCPCNLVKYSITGSRLSSAHGGAGRAGALVSVGVWGAEVAGEGLWQLLSADLVQVLLALSSEAGCRLAGLGDLGGLGLGDVLVGLEGSADLDDLLADQAGLLLALGLFLLAVGAVPLEGLLDGLVLVVGLGGVLRFALALGGDLPVAWAADVAAGDDGVGADGSVALGGERGGEAGSGAGGEFDGGGGGEEGSNGER